MPIVYTVSMGTQFLVQMNNYFTVGIRTELVPAGPKFAGQFVEVENFAVEYKDYRTVLIRYRLAAALDVLDAESPDTEMNKWFDVIARLIGTTVLQDRSHGPDSVI